MRLLKNLRTSYTESTVTKQGSKINAERLNLIVLGLFAFIIPMSPALIPLFAVLLVVAWMLNKGWHISFRFFKSNSLPYLYMALYGFYVLGMLHTNNIAFGAKDLETKFSLLLFPLILPGMRLHRTGFESVLALFILGCFLSSLVSLGNAIYNYSFNDIERVGAYVFVGGRLSPSIHPGYLSMYLNFAIAALYHLHFFGKMKPLTINKKTMIYGIIWFSIFIFLLASKAGLITLCVSSFAIILQILVGKKSRKIPMVILASLASVFFITFMTVPEFARKFKEVTESVRHSKQDVATTESSAVRLLVWKASIRLLTKAPLFGVGTGDVKQATLDEYATEGMEGAMAHKLNSHNQFLQTGIAIGLPGMMLLLGGMVIAILIGYKRKQGLLVAFIVIVTITALVESILETQAGVVFYAFINSFLLFLYRPVDEQKDDREPHLF